MTTLCRLSAVVLFLVPAWSQISTVTVVPAQPTASDPVTVNITGNWIGAGCDRVYISDVSVSTSTITINLIDQQISLRGAPCTFLIPFPDGSVQVVHDTSFQENAFVGTLAPGAYTVNVFVTGRSSFFASTTVVVAGAAVPASSWFSLIALGAGLAFLRSRIVCRALHDAVRCA